MFERLHQFAFTPEARAEVFVFGVVRQQHFQGDRAVVFRIQRLIDTPHPTDTDITTHEIAVDILPDELRIQA